MSLSLSGTFGRARKLRTAQKMPRTPTSLAGHAKRLENQFCRQLPFTHFLGEGREGQVRGGFLRQSGQGAVPGWVEMAPALP